MEGKETFKVLIIDDSIALATSLQNQIAEEDKGIEVEIATNGIRALDKLETFKPDIILLDIIMPEMDGFEFLDALRKEKKDTSTPVVMLTNIDQKSIIDKAFLKGANDYFVKLNYSVSELITKIKKIIKESKE